MSRVNKTFTDGFTIGFITVAILALGWGLGIGFLLFNK